MIIMHGRQIAIASFGNRRGTLKGVAPAGRPRFPTCKALEGARRTRMPDFDYPAMLQIALEEAQQGRAEGGIPIGAALFHRQGQLLGRGHNRRVQENDPSAHAETDAFRKAGRQRRYRDTIMVTTLAPCWYCSGLVRQFRIGTVVVGESVNFSGGLAWLR